MVWFRFLPDWRLLAVAAVRDFGLRRGVWRGTLALRVEREIPRFPLHHPLHRAIRVFHFTGGLYLAQVPKIGLARLESGRLLYSLNPMVGVIDGFRWALLRGQTRIHAAGVIGPDPFDWSSLLMSCSIVIVLLVSGIWYFRKMERTFADVI